MQYVLTNKRGLKKLVFGKKRKKFLQNIFLAPGYTEKNIKAIHFYFMLSQGRWNETVEHHRVLSLCFSCSLDGYILLNFSILI